MNNGGQAFPHTIPITTESDPKIIIGQHIQQGMTLRDYFASSALCGMLLYVTRHQPKPSECAEMSYRMADAMLKARKVNPTA